MKDVLLSNNDLINSEIFCSSDGESLSTGENYIKDILNAIQCAYGQIMIISPRFMKSQFCLAELGAIWETKEPKRIFALLTDDVPDNVLKDTPLANVQIAHLKDIKQWADTIFKSLEKANVDNSGREYRSLSTANVFQFTAEIEKSKTKVVIASDAGRKVVTDKSTNDVLTKKQQTTESEPSKNGAKKHLVGFLVTKGWKNIKTTSNYILGDVNGEQVYLEMKYSKNYQDDSDKKNKVWSTWYTITGSLLSHLSEKKVDFLVFMVGYRNGDGQVAYDFLIVPRDIILSITGVPADDHRDFFIFTKSCDDNQIADERAEHGEILVDYNKYLNNFAQVMN